MYDFSQRELKPVTSQAQGLPISRLPNERCTGRVSYRKVLASRAVLHDSLATELQALASNPGAVMSEPIENTRIATAATVGGAIPILRVASLDASIAYYTQRLGCEVQWRSDSVASVCRDRMTIMLCEGDQGHAGTWLWIAATDVDALYAEFERRGAHLRHEPANYPWGSRECQITDLDGHVLRFGADVRDGQPIGDWLDGNGQRWLPEPNGEWRSAE
jgi:catechol 2,3-dioxygenase-like lactoylglutathione lyase family enzyme